MEDPGFSEFPGGGPFTVGLNYSPTVPQQRGKLFFEFWVFVPPLGTLFMDPPGSVRPPVSLLLL